MHQKWTWCMNDYNHRPCFHFFEISNCICLGTMFLFLLKFHISMFPFFMIGIFARFLQIAHVWLFMVCWILSIWHLQLWVKPRWDKKKWKNNAIHKSQQPLSLKSICPLIFFFIPEDISLKDQEKMSITAFGFHKSGLRTFRIWSYCDSLHDLDNKKET